MCNLSFGIFSIILASKGSIKLACYCIFIAGLFDFLDGFIARLLTLSSEFGKQLDSLSDMISFGVAPCFIILAIFDSNYSINFSTHIVLLIIPICSALRLAKFNLNNEQNQSFLGLPTPANAMFLASLSLFITSNCNYNIYINYYLLIFVVIVMALLLVIPMRFFSLKFTSYKWDKNLITYIFIIFSILIIITSFLLNNTTISVAIIILLYILISIVSNLISYKKKL